MPHLDLESRFGPRGEFIDLSLGEHLNFCLPMLYVSI
jgi:hypothetical protein